MDFIQVDDLSHRDQKTIRERKRERERDEKINRRQTKDEPQFNDVDHVVVEPREKTTFDGSAAHLVWTDFARCVFVGFLVHLTLLPIFSLYSWTSRTFIEFVLFLIKSQRLAYLSRIRTIAALQRLMVAPNRISKKEL